MFQWDYYECKTEISEGCAGCFYKACFSGIIMNVELK
jgi:hypothetical protein